MRAFQHECMSLLADIERQLEAVASVEGGACRVNRAVPKAAHCSRHNKQPYLHARQRVHYSTEAFIQKRIRVHRRQYSSCGGSIQNLTKSEIIEKNKNPLAFETMV